MNAKLLAGAAAFLFLIGRAAYSLGLGSTDVEPASIIEEPDAESGIMAILPEGVTFLIRYVQNALGNFWQLMTFQLEIPALINGVLTVSMTFVVLWLVATLLRGGAR